MNSNQDPRVQIYTNLDEVQNEIEKAAKERKDEINNQRKEDTNALKDEMKELKDEVKDSYKELKQQLKDSDDPNAKEKIEIAKQTRKIIENNIDADYEQSKESVEMHAEDRINSIESMLDDTNEDIRRDEEVYMAPDAYQDNIMHTDIVNKDALRDTEIVATGVVAERTVPHSTRLEDPQPIKRDNNISVEDTKDNRMRDKNNSGCGCGDIM